MDEFIRTNPWAPSLCEVNNNYYYKIRELAHVHGGRSDMAQGFEQGHLSDLPASCNYVSPSPIDLEAFVEVSSLDFNFKPAFQPMPGFRKIPFDRIGLYVDEYRKSAPDKQTYRRAIYDLYKDDRAKGYDPDRVSKRYPPPTYLR